MGGQTHRGRASEVESARGVETERRVSTRHLCAAAPRRGRRIRYVRDTQKMVGPQDVAIYSCDLWNLLGAAFVFRFPLI
jgi:hypothetical protein